MWLGWQDSSDCRLRLSGVPQASSPQLWSLPEPTLCILRSGSVGARWRSSPALTWATCSERPHPTRFLGEPDRSSTKTTGAWRRSGWTNSKTSFTLFLLVSWAGGAGSPQVCLSPLSLSLARSLVCVGCVGSSTPHVLLYLRAAPPLGGWRCFDAALSPSVVHTLQEKMLDQSEPAAVHRSDLSCTCELLSLRCDQTLAVCCCFRDICLKIRTKR